MSKRIFTVILALVLSLTALSFGAEAEWSGAKLEYDESGKTLKLSWVEFSADVAKYTATIYNNSNNIVRTQTFTKDESGNIATELVYNNPFGGKHYAKVVAYDESDGELDTCTTNVLLVPIVIVNNGITLTLTADGSVSLTWNEIKNAKNYTVEVTYIGADNTTQVITHDVGAATAYAVTDAEYDNLTSITLNGYDSYYNKRVIGTITLSAYSAADSGVGQVSLNCNTGILSWINQGSQPHYVTAYLIGQSLGKQNCLMQGSCDVSSLLRQFYNQVIYFTVYAGDPDNGGVAIGSATYYPTNIGSAPGSSYTTNSSLTVMVSETTANVDWSFYLQQNYTGQYIVNYILNGEKKTAVLDNTVTSIDLPWAGGLMVDVMAFNGYGYQSIGTATVDRDGTVIYNTRANENSIIGDNCTIIVGMYTSELIWNDSSDTVRYEIEYTDNVTGTTRTTQTYFQNYYNTAASIPIGYDISTDFSVRVLAYTSNGQPSIVASVDYKGTSSGQTPTPTVCEHTFEYQSCTEVHWKHCTKCGYTCEVGEHSAANGSCSVCGRSSTTSRFDVNGDGQVNLQDAVMILRRLAHLD